MEQYKIGNTIIIINSKHKYYNLEGKITKITKNNIGIRIKGKSTNGKNILINKKYVKLIPRTPLDTEGIFIHNSREKLNFDYYLQKAFPEEDFEDFVLFNFMRPSSIALGEGIKRWLPKKEINLTSKEMLDKKIKQKKIVSSNYAPCAFFTPIPRKFFSKYFENELIERYNNDMTKVFICLDIKILCNLPDNYWVGINIGNWYGGPTILQQDEDIPDVTYIMDRCDNKPSLSKEFRDFFIDVLLREEFSFLEKEKFSLHIKKKFEKEFIDYLREKGKNIFLDSEIFVCSMGWEDYKGVTVRFSEQEVLAANYKKEDVAENIKKVLKG